MLPNLLVIKCMLTCKGSSTTMPPLCEPSLDMTPMMVLYDMKNSPNSSWMSMMTIVSIAHCILLLPELLPHSLFDQVTPVYVTSSLRNLIHVTQQIYISRAR